MLQAMNGDTMHPDLLSRRLLRESAWEKYDADMDFLWSHSYRLSTNVILYGKIMRFPFEVFGDPDNMCWGLFADALLESCTIAIYRLAWDQTRGALTVGRFRDWMLSNSSHPEASTELRDRLSSLVVDGIQADTCTRVKEFRHNWLAHIGQRETILANTSGLFPSIGELERCCDAIHADIDTMSLDSTRMQTYSQYQTRRGEVHEGQPTDLDRLLDLVALHSALYRMPEEQPGYWPVHKSGLPASQLRTLEAYRERLGKPLFVLCGFTPIPQ